MKTKEKKVKLLPCPWCGEIPAVLKKNDYILIKCLSWGCHVNPDIQGYFSDNEIRELWNSREK